MTDYFISDLHLEESRPDITRAFLSFTDAIKASAKSLYILGDFFESWIGDDENTALQVTIKHRLKSLSDSGIQLFFMHGNRDFLVGERFTAETGTTILDDPSTIQLSNKTILLMHGDSLCTHDTAYMKFRATIRNPNFLAPFLKRPIEERKITAQQLRAMSQANNQDKTSEIMDVTPEEVILKMQQHQVQMLIHGHTHRPNIHSININDQTNSIEHTNINEQAYPSKQKAKRYVLGDWDKNVWFIKVEANQDPELMFYPLEQALQDAKTFTPAKS